MESQFTAMTAATPASAAGSAPMSTVYCNYCSVQLSYPAGSVYIQCPKCQQIMNPQAAQQTHCQSCNTLLAHPPTSVYIQCPKCLTIMNAREGSRGGGGAARDNGMGKYGYQQPSTAEMPKVKKKRDRDAPKAASNAYMIFCKEMRPKLKEENPTLSFGKIGQRLGEMWRNLSADEKKPYEDRAAADRERYRKAMESYQLTSPNKIPKLSHSGSEEDETGTADGLGLESENGDTKSEHAENEHMHHHHHHLGDLPALPGPPVSSLPPQMPNSHPEAESTRGSSSGTSVTSPDPPVEDHAGVEGAVL